MPNEKYIRRKYERWQAYWPDHDFPEWADLDFGYRSFKDEWGSVDFLPDSGIRLSLDPLCQRYPSLAKPILAHEMNHIALGPKAGHGKKFHASMLEALNRGLIYENII